MMTGAGSPTEFLFTASKATPAAVRVELRRWLDHLNWPTDEADQIVFCVSEAVTNIVEHAYLGQRNPNSEARVQISACLETVADPGFARMLRWVCIDIHDTGRWRDPSPHRDGLGLPLLRRLLDNVVVITRGTPDYGTTVSIRSHPIEPRRAVVPSPRSPAVLDARPGVWSGRVGVVGGVRQRGPGTGGSGPMRRR